MEAKAIDILDAHRTMAIATVRPDGWPQSTIVGYANDGFLIYFMVSRNSTCTWSSTRSWRSMRFYSETKTKTESPTTRTATA